MIDSDEFDSDECLNLQLDATSEPEREHRLKTRYDAIVSEGRGELVEWLVGKEAICEKVPHLAQADIAVR